MLRWIELLALALSSLALQAQTGIGTTTPDANAMLDIESTQKGVLLPQLTTAQQAVLAATLGAGQMGMLARDSATGKLITWGGTSWTDISTTTITATAPLSISSTNVVSLNPGTASGDLITWDGTNWVNMQPATQHFSITVDNRQPLLSLNYCIALTGIFPSQSTYDPYVGEIDLFSFNFAPKGYAFCNGQLLAINTNAALFSLVGTYYGGNGINTFGLPNLQGRVPIDIGSGSGLSTYTIGQTGGTESNTISQ